jgi:4-hydroxythreonine-4-phosphate dehydrogenase
LDVKNSESVLKTLDVAIEGVQKKYFDAMVTAPIQKSIINVAGVQFSGHTEYLAQQTNTPEVVMMLAGENALQPGQQLRVALATTHVPLKEVSNKINKVKLLKQLQIIHADLKNKFGFSNPHIAVAGLNPHAGEGGYLGQEEIEEIAPAIAAACSSGMRVSGPYPADTLFLPHSLEGVDCVLAMYHDQGLPVLKFASFGHGVNVTLGLPLIRTSVDHGTALDVAKKGLGYAESGSMESAMLLAAQMVGNQA